MKGSKKLLSLCLSALLAASVGLPVGAAAAKTPSFSDTRDHWARDYIQSGVSRGYIAGYENGTFRPDSPVTRAEFCKMANNALGVTLTATIGFKDVSSGDWYYTEVRRAVAAGYITGYEDGTFRPNANITRQEAAVVLSRLVTPPSTDKSLYDFRDSASIDDWAQPGARTAYAKSYMAGDDNRNFRPRGNLTRAESAKIVEAVLGGESLVRSDVTVSGAQTLSGGLYTGNVTLASGLGNGDVTLRNCRVLGTLTVNGGGQVTLNHTGVNNLVVSRSNGTPDITASGGSSVRQTTVNNACTLEENGLTGTGFTNVTLTGSALKSDTVTLSGGFDTVSLTSPARLDLTKGTIASLNLSSGAAGSRVNLAGNTRVAAAAIAGGADFTGTGRITKAAITASNVTFETPPDDGSGYQTLTPAVTPKNGASEVAVDTKITLAFAETIKTDGNKDLTRAYVEDDVVELRAGRETGSRVSFSAALSNSNRTITLTPEESLDRNTTYYVILLKNSLRNTEGTYNARQVYSFSTVGGLTPVTNPVDGSGTVPVGTAITLTFGDALVRGDTYGSLSSDYLNKYCFDFTRGSAGGKDVGFTAAISSDRKTITITPGTDLDTSTKYYVTIRKDSLANGSRSMVKEQSFSFTTAGSEVLVPVMNPPTGSKDVEREPTLKLTFNEALYTPTGGTAFSTSDLTNAFTLYRSSNSASNRVDLDVTLNSTRRVITIVPRDELRANTTYYLELKKNSFSDRSGSSGRNSNIAMTFTFTTGAEAVTGTLTPTPLPKSGATGVATTPGPIRLVFDGNIYNSSGGSLTASYLKNTVLELRESSSTGSTVGFTAAVDGQVITLTPSVSSLKNSTRYYVIVKEGTLRNSSSSSSGKTNSKFTAYFNTGSSSTALQADSAHNGASNISPSTPLVLEYGAAVYNNVGETLSSSYIRGAVKLYKGTSESSSNAVSFGSGSIANNRTLTLTPGTALADNTTYRVVIPAGSFTNSSGVPNTKQVFDFTVGSATLSPTMTPANNATNVSVGASLVFEFPAVAKNATKGDLTADYVQTKVFVIYQGATGTTKLSGGFTASLDSETNTRRITLTPNSPLTSDTIYRVVLQADALSTTAGAKNSAHTFTFRTQAVTAVAAPTLTWEGGSASIPKELNLTFASGVTQENGSALSKAYVEEHFKLKKGSAGGAEQPFTARISGSTVILTPTFPEDPNSAVTVQSLEPETSYFITVPAGKLKNSTGGVNQAISLSFTTGAPVIAITPSPADKPTGAVISCDYQCDFTVTLKGGGGSVDVGAYSLDKPFSSFRVDLDLTPGTTYTLEVRYAYGGKTKTATQTILIPLPSGNAALDGKNFGVKYDGTLRKAGGSGTSFAVSGIPAGEVEIWAVPADPKATVTINGTEGVKLTGQTLSPGDTTYTIVVTAEDNTKETYTLTVTAEAPEIPEP